jgi:hypothetical protein
VRLRHEQQIHDAASTPSGELKSTHNTSLRAIGCAAQVIAQWNTMNVLTDIMEHKLIFIETAVRAHANASRPLKRALHHDLAQSICSNQLVGRCCRC